MNRLPIMLRKGQVGIRTGDAWEPRAQSRLRKHDQIVKCSVPGCEHPAKRIREHTALGGMNLCAPHRDEHKRLSELSASKLLEEAKQDGSEFERQHGRHQTQVSISRKRAPVATDEGSIDSKVR